MEKKEQKVVPMTIPNSRLLFILAAIACGGLTGFSLFLQHVEGLDPCPLCISQRITIALLGGITLLAGLHNPQRTGFKVYSGLVALLGMAGMALATRQLWVQHLPPDKVPTCMPGLEYLVDMIPFTDLVRIMLTGTGDCAQVQWTFLGLNIPGWTLLVFTGFVVFGVIEFFRKK